MRSLLLLSVCVFVCYVCDIHLKIPLDATPITTRGSSRAAATAAAVARQILFQAALSTQIAVDNLTTTPDRGGVGEEERGK